MATCGRVASATQAAGSSCRPSQRPPLQMELSEPGDGVGGGEQAGEADLAAGGVAQPGGGADAEGIEEPGTQVVGETLAGAGAGRSRRGCTWWAGCRRRRCRGRGPVGSGGSRGRVRSPLGGGSAPGLGEVAAGHRREVPDEHGAAAGIGDVGVEFGKVRQHRGVEVEQALGGGQARGRGGEALAEGVEQVGTLLGVGRPPAVGDDRAVPQDHQAVGRGAGDGLQGVQEGLDALGIDALAGRSAGGQRTGAQGVPPAVRGGGTRPVRGRLAAAGVRPDRRGRSAGPAGRSGGRW